MKIFIILAILVIVVFGFMLFMYYDEEEMPASPGMPGQITSSFDKELSKCIQTDEFSEQCKLILSDLSAAGNCPLTDDKDKCYYTVATFQRDSTLCDEITNAELKDKCAGSFALMPGLEQQEEE